MRVKKNKIIKHCNSNLRGTDVRRTSSTKFAHSIKAFGCTDIQGTKEIWLHHKFVNLFYQTTHITLFEPDYIYIDFFNLSDPPFQLQSIEKPHVQQNRKHVNYAKADGSTVERFVEYLHRKTLQHIQHESLQSPYPTMWTLSVCTLEVQVLLEINWVIKDCIWMRRSFIAMHSTKESQTWTV